MDDFRKEIVFFCVLYMLVEHIKTKCIGMIKSNSIRY